MMKRVTGILLAVLLVCSMLLAGCGQEAPSGSETESGRSDSMISYGTNESGYTGEYTGNATATTPDGSSIGGENTQNSGGGGGGINTKTPTKNGTTGGGGTPTSSNGSGGNNSGKVIEASFTRNADGTCTDKASGVVFLDDDLDDMKKMFEHGTGLLIDGNDPALFNGDSARVTRSDGSHPDDYWFTYKLDAGITEISLVVFLYEKADPNATLKISVSPDNKTWKTVNVTKADKADLNWDTWMMYTITAKGIDKSNKYVKIDLGKAPSPHWNVNVSRLRINNIAKMNDADRFLEIRESATYYIDSKRGSDSNDGLSEAKPFKSLSKLSSKFFQEGDRILFKKGETYSGALTLKGYGTASNPIRVGTYGSGNMPKIDGRGARAGITLTANHIVVDGLEVTNANGNYGIYIGALQAGENAGITVSNCYVHDVDTNEKKFSYLESGGIIARADGTSPTWFKGVNIQNNTIKNVCRCAVVISNSWGWRYSDGSYIKNKYVSDTNGWYPNVDCKITNNSIDGTKGDSILVQCGKNTLIERNTVYNANSSTKEHAKVAMVAIWTISTVDTVMQYNEVGYTKRPGADGEAFDTDHAEVNCKIQYNYSHNNEGGFVLLCNGYPGTAKNATVRYNLSVNDGAKCAVINLVGDIPGTQVYNNTFYLGNQVKSVMSMWGNDGKPTKATGITLTNNIFSAPTAGTGNYWSGGSVGTDFYNAVTNIKFNNNLFHNVNQPQQKGGVTLSGNVSGNPNFALSTDYKNKANMIKGFTPRNKVSGAVDVANNGGKDINGNAAASKIFGCVNY